MAEPAVGKAVAQILHSLAREQAEHDFRLLDRFAQNGDERAFEVLIQPRYAVIRWSGAPASEWPVTTPTPKMRFKARFSSCVER